MKRLGMIVAAVALVAATQAADRIYTGPNGGAWSDAGNWDTGAPGANDTAWINSNSVVNLDFEWLPNPLVVNVDGTIDQTGAMRLWDVQVHVSSSGELDGTGGGWVVLWGGGAEVNFDSGAKLTQDSGRIQFANNSDQTLGFNLDSSGFVTMTNNLLEFDGYANQTIKADLANYTGGTNMIVLMDLSGNNGLTEEIFQDDLNPTVVNVGTFTNSYLKWNETTSAIELYITDVAPEPPAPPTYENYVWENDMSVDPVGNGWIVRDPGTANDYTVGGGLLSMNEGIFTTVLDTTGFTNVWKGITRIDMDWRSTSTNTYSGLGAGIWVNVDTDAPDYGAIHFDAVLEGDDTQTFKIFSGFDTLLLAVPGFSSNMLTLHAEVRAFDREVIYEITDGVLTNSGTVAYDDLPNGGEPGLGTLFTAAPSAEFDYVKLDVNAAPAEAFTRITPEELNLLLSIPETLVTGSVDVVYGSATDLEVSAAVTDESHPGSFSVLSATPQVLDPVAINTLSLEFEYDNTVYNLPPTSSATGLVAIAVSEAGSGVTNEFLVPIKASVVQLAVWDDTGGGSSFENADNWVGDIAPISTNSSVLFDSAVSGNDCYINSEFTIGANQSALVDGGIVWRFGADASLTLQTGGTLDFRTEGFGSIAENQDVPVFFTYESGAVAEAYNVFGQSNWSHTFVAGASGVTTFGVDNLYVNGGTLVVDVSSYDAINGTALVLFDYGNLNGSGTFDIVTVVGGSGTIDYAYDIGGGDLGIALIVPSLLTAQGTPFDWLGGYYSDLVVSNDYEVRDLEDTDLDGHASWQENQAGTNPTNAASVLNMYAPVEIAPGQYEISWQGVSNKTYSVLFADDLMASWSTIGTGISGVEPDTVVTAAVATVEAYFKVEVE